MSSTIGSTLRVRAFLFFVAASVLPGMGCSPQEPRISIESQYASLSELFLGTGSVFMNIRNTGGQDALLAAAVDVPGAVTELHDIKGRRMVRLDRLVIPAGGVVELKPGGMHIMVFNMPRTVAPGAEMALKLTFERSGEKQVKVRFEKTDGLQGRR